MAKYFEHNQIQFHYSDEGKGPALVFLHGLGGDLQQAREATSLVKAKRVISFDFRGHGKTNLFVTESDAKMDVFVKDLLNIVQYLGIEEFVLGGISLGAAVSLKFALNHREMVNKLILVRPAWINKPDPPHFSLLKLAHEKIQKFGIDTGEEYFTETPAFIRTQEEFPGYAESLLRQFTRPQASTSYALLKHLPEDVPFSSMAELASLDMPVLIVGSDDDPLHPFEYAETLYRQLSQSKLEKTVSKYLEPGEHLLAVQSLIRDFMKLDSPPYPNEIS